MSFVIQSAQPLDVAAARDLPPRTAIVLVDDRTGEVRERVTVLRYAGHYRSGAIDAFAVKDSEGKFRVLSARALGFTDDAALVSYPAGDYDAALAGAGAAA